MLRHNWLIGADRFVFPLPSCLKAEKFWRKNAVNSIWEVFSSRYLSKGDLFVRPPDVSRCTIPQQWTIALPCLSTGGARCDATMATVASTNAIASTRQCSAHSRIYLDREQISLSFGMLRLGVGRGGLMEISIRDIGMGDCERIIELVETRV